MSSTVLNFVFSTASAPAEESQSPADSVTALTRRLRAGDDKAFREFHGKYFDRLYQFLLVLTGGREADAQDAFQETLLRVSKYVREFEEEEVFWCWLKMVARSAVRDRGRKIRRHFAFLQRFAIERQGEMLANEDIDPLAECLDQALAKLDDSDRELIEAKYFEKASIRELSVRSGLTERAVESRLLRLRRQLREETMNRLQGL